MEIPISAISPDQLPAETPLKYDAICRIIGSLYLDSIHRISTLEEHFKSIIASYAERNEQLMTENNILKSKLENG